MYYSLKVGIVITPVLFLLLSIVMAIQDLLFNQMNFIVDFSISVVNVITNLMGIALNVYIAFGKIAIWEIIPFSVVCFDFFCQWCTVFIVKVFHFLYSVYSK
jgi:hypothetical protein